MKLRLSLSVVSFFLLLSLPIQAQQKSVLFDAAHAQTAGNADWTLDEDTCGTAQRYPTPDQAGITSSTPETYWSGGFSAFGVDLVKKGFHVESLPVGGRITYNDSSNAQDLKNYNVFVVGEPNVRFTAAEITAMRSFVQNGGGLFMIADHAGADRNNDGWDPPKIFNDLMGSPSVFGFTFGAVSTNKTTDWFDDHPDVNYTTDTTSPIIFTGPYGSPSSTKGLGLFGSTSMTITASNAKGHIWMTSGTHDTSSKITFITATYGTGRVAAVGDSSTAEDATNGCGHTTYLGYNDPSYDNGRIFANAVAWIAKAGVSSGDTTPPTASITSPASGATLSGTATVNATASDNSGTVSKVEFYLDGTLASTDTTSPYSWSWNTSGASNGSHGLVARAYDAAGNIGSSSTVNVTVSNSGGPQPLIQNPGFENGSSSPAPWTVSSGVINNGTGEAAHSGSWKAWMNGYGSAHTDSIQQTVSIPSTATSATLTFWLHIDTAETGTTAYDTLKVQVRNTSGTVLATLATYSNVNAASGYSQKSLSMTAYKGQTVQIYLVGTEDASAQTSFVVDDFFLNAP